MFTCAQINENMYQHDDCMQIRVTCVYIYMQIHAHMCKYVQIHVNMCKHLDIHYNSANTRLYVYMCVALITHVWQRVSMCKRLQIWVK